MWPVKLIRLFKAMSLHHGSKHMTGYFGDGHMPPECRGIIF